MKKKITILFLMLLSVANVAYGWDCSCGSTACGLHHRRQYPGEVGWPTAAEILARSGTITSLDFTITDDNTTVLKTTKYITINYNLKFKEFFTFCKVSDVFWDDGYVARFGKFDTHYEVVITDENNKTTTRTYDKTYSITPEYINNNWNLGYEVHYREHPLTGSLSVELPNAGKIFKCTLKARVLPTYNAGVSDDPVKGNHLVYNWGYASTCNIKTCIPTQRALTSSNNNKTTTIRRIQDYSISVDESINPKTSISGNNYYAIYNEPTSKISMRLNSNEVEKKKTYGSTQIGGRSVFVKKINNDSYSMFNNNNIISLTNLNFVDNNIAYSSIRTLSEFGNVNNADKISITHRLIYNTLTLSNSNINQTSNRNIPSNSLDYIVVPQVKFADFTESELSAIYKYNGTGAAGSHNVIGLKKRYIEVIGNANISTSIYKPEYKWQYSFTGSEWIDIPTAYIINGTVNGVVGDFLVSSKILGDKNICYIRQKAILKAFSNTEITQLYKEKVDNKYYIAVESNIYTIKKIPTITSDNIKLTGNILTGNIISNLNTKYNPSSNYNGKKIKFELTGLDANVIEAINKTATYSLSVKKNGISENILNYNKDTGYYISGYKYGEWVFTCKLTLGNGEVLTKDITLNSYPEAYFNQLTNEEKKAVYKCYTKGNNVTSKNEVISLKNKEVRLNNQYLDLSLCLPEYYWEYSYDNTNWVKLDNTYKAKFSNLALSDGDIYISSAIFTENEKNVYFRQRAILKAFVSTDKKEQFTEYFENNGKKGYYIATTSGTYTFKKIPTPQDVNFSFVKGDNNISTDSKVCFLESAEFYNGKNIELEFVKDANLSDDEFTALKNMALYRIYRKGEKEGDKDTELNHPYTISGYKNGQSITYLCKIIFGETVSLEKEITISSYPEEKIDINKIEAQTNGASIVSRDIANMTLQAVCPKGEEFKIKYYLADSIRPNIGAYESKIEYTCPEYPEMVPYEDIVPFVPYPEMVPYPEYEPTDFSTWKFGELEDLIISKGWDAGIYWDDVTIGFLRNTARDKEEAEYYQLKQGYEMQYDIDKLAYELQYEADKQAYIDDYNTKKAEFEAGCAAKITWQEFDDNLNYTTTLENITENKDNAVFYMRTKSTDENGSCYSGVVTINVTYIDGISNNLIEFVGDEFKGKDSIIVTAGDGNPAIKGELVEGGFGIPKDNADCIYSYTWKYYNEALSTWEKLVDDNGNELMFDEYNTNDGNRAEIRNVSLEADILKNAIASNPTGLKIARFVSSYKINEMSSKMEYMSNVLVISSSKLIEDDKFTYEKSDKFCPGAGSVNILFTDVELEENEVIDVKVLEKDQEELEKVFNYEKRFVSIVNPYKDFNVSICRRDTITNVKSNDVVLEIDIPEFKADFMVSVDYIDHELTEDRINVQSGSRVKLINTTVDEIGGTLYNWTLQVQKDGLLAQPSEKESPVCYLYNPGLNQIRLEVINANKCKSVVTADNIFVTGLPDNRSSSFFADDEANEQMLATESYIRVYPTILIDENIVNVQSNIERYDVVITDVAGKVMLVAENLTMSSTLDLAFLPNGIYILNASGNAFKLIKK